MKRWPLLVALSITVTAAIAAVAPPIVPPAGDLPARPQVTEQPPLRRQGPPSGIVTKVVPSVVVETEVRYEQAPGVAELLPQLKYTTTPRINKKRPVEIPAGGYRDPDGLPVHDQEVASAVEGAFGFTFDSFQYGGVFPPDPHGAAGPTQVVNVVNSSIAIFDKLGTLQTSGTLFSFFDPISSTSTFDPRVIYDTIHGRFVVITLEFFNPGPQSKILVAVSDDSDALGTWYLQEVNALTLISGENRWSDYPALGVDEDNVYVTTNMWGVSSGNFANSQIFMIRKGAGSGGLYDGGVGTVTKVLPPGSGSGNFTLAPGRMIEPHPNSTVGTFFSSYNGAFVAGGDKLIQVYTLTNPLGSPTLTQELINIGNAEQSSQVPNAPQLSGHTAIDTDNKEIMGAVWRDDTLTLVSTFRVSNQATVHWMQMDTSALFGTTLIDQGNVDGEEIAATTHTFYPSIAVDSVGRIGIGFAASGANLNVGSYFAYRFPTDPPGTHQPSQVVRAGNGTYVRIDNNGRNRWGDYTGIDFDPVDDCFWVYNEYVKTPHVWGTAWGQFCLDFACGDNTLQPGETCDPPGEPAGQPDACRQDCFYCGDGGLQAVFEDCDDSNNTDGDGCDRNCRYEYCGNGVLQVGEQCDPPGAPAGQPDACRFDCRFCGDGNVDAAGGELIANGGFELGAFAGWTPKSDGAGAFFVDAPGSTTPVSGRATKPKLGAGLYYAVSDANGSGAQALEQAFSVPADATGVVLTFDMFVNNWNAGGTFVDPAGLDWDILPAANQHARVDLLNPGFPDFDTSPAAVVNTYYIGADAGLNPHNFVTYVLDITSDVVPGQTYVLRYANVHNQNTLNMGVNLVSIEVDTPAEVCDDGNNVGGDLCTSTCKLCTTAAFGQNVLALDEDTFSWSNPVDTFWAVGVLADVGLYSPTSTGSAPYVTSIDVTGTPAPGTGIYAVFRVDCPGASWDSGGSGQCCVRTLP